MTVLTVFCFVCVCPYPGGRGEGVLNKFIYGGGGGVHLEVQPLTLLETIFHEKGTPFRYLLFTNGTPFAYLVFRTLHPFQLL